MNRCLQCAFGMAALLVSSSACAQNFGNKGQLAISAERLFGFYHDSATVSVNNVDTTTKSDSFSLLSSPIPLAGSAAGAWGYGSPRVAGDYFVIDHLSVGAALGYSHISVGTPGFGGTTTTDSGDSFLFAPRAGWAYMFSDIVGIWPRAGFTYRTLSAGNNSAHDFALTAEVPFVFTVIPHVGFWAGPTLDLGISGSESNTTGAVTRSVDFNATEIGIQTGMTAYFDL